MLFKNDSTNLNQHQRKISQRINGFSLESPRYHTITSKKNIWTYSSISINDVLFKIFWLSHKDKIVSKNYDPILPSKGTRYFNIISIIYVASVTSLSRISKQHSIDCSVRFSLCDYKVHLYSLILIYIACCIFNCISFLIRAHSRRSKHASDVKQPEMTGFLARGKVCY